MSLTSCVPAAVPSLLNSSRPVEPLSAKKNRVPLTSVIWTGLEDRVAGLTSASSDAGVVRSSSASKSRRERVRAEVAFMIGLLRGKRLSRIRGGDVGGSVPRPADGEYVGPTGPFRPVKG